MVVTLEAQLLCRKCPKDVKAVKRTLKGCCWKNSSVTHKVKQERLLAELRDAKAARGSGEHDHHITQRFHQKDRIAETDGTSLTLKVLKCC